MKSKAYVLGFCIGTILTLILIDDVKILIFFNTISIFLLTLSIIDKEIKDKK
jgi:hypothetical protein